MTNPVGGSSVNTAGYPDGANDQASTSVDLSTAATAAAGPAEQALNNLLESEIISDFTSNSFLYGEEDEEGKFY